VSMDGKIGEVEGGREGEEGGERDVLRRLGAKNPLNDIALVKWSQVSTMLACSPGSEEAKSSRTGGHSLALSPLTARPWSLQTLCRRARGTNASTGRTRTAWPGATCTVTSSSRTGSCITQCTRPCRGVSWYR